MFVNNCEQSSGGRYAKSFCVTASTTSAPRNNKPKAEGVSGGVVAAAILVPLVIIAIAAVAIFFVCRGKKSALASGNEPTGNPNYGTV